MGWQNNNLVHEKIRICQKDVIDKVVVFGDSFVEFYGKSNANLVQKLNSKYLMVLKKRQLITLGFCI